MDENDNATKSLDSNPASSQDLLEQTDSRVRVEPCEFEELLQRAMEILSARARGATASRS
jgi:hypothetical protein